MPRSTHESRWMTIPNIVTSVRLVGSPILIGLGWAQRLDGLVILVVFLVFTEWLDGFLARRMNVNSPIGARLDTVADGVFYGSLLIALSLLKPTLIGREVAWMAIAAVSYAVNCGASWFKFGQLPSYHTWGAKAVWLVVGTGIACLIAEISPWPFRIAMMCVVWVNLEATLITITLHESRVDVPTFWHAKRIAQDSTVESTDKSNPNCTMPGEPKN